MVAAVEEGGGAVGGFLAKEAVVEVAAVVFVAGAEVEVTAVGVDVADEMMEEGGEEVEVACQRCAGYVLRVGDAAGVVDADGGLWDAVVVEEPEADLLVEAGFEALQLGGGVDGGGVVAIAEAIGDKG